jgi:hypothetical protein
MKIARAQMKDCEKEETLLRETPYSNLKIALRIGGPILDNGTTTMHISRKSSEVLLKTTECLKRGPTRRALPRFSQENQHCTQLLNWKRWSRLHCHHCCSLALASIPIPP